MTKCGVKLIGPNETIIAECEGRKNHKYMHSYTILNDGRNLGIIWKFSPFDIAKMEEESPDVVGKDMAKYLNERATKNSNMYSIKKYKEERI